ncbi:aldose 1-epimerase [Arachidicoccus rhizosphaerae]|uniref:Aldose 1-epimerase n=1 Tax=Arachidicoccus rhizosphaerae TaxID=551991 RepID=A0A1H3ZUA4_9BACT|nr:aldose epimerase family protein [Arachidicoccus rhizosphaerae]SEA27240.1 aldose 1-epimerase [Arachidicoccus rhizosphaerae]
MNRKWYLSFCSLALAAGLVSCGGSGTQKQNQTDSTKKAVTVSSWGTYDGSPVLLYHLDNGHGTKMAISNYGGTITSWRFPDRNADTSEIIVGFDSLSGYLAHPPYFGALIGRYANRIAKGKFTLDGKTYQLAVNDGHNHLHGGIKGFDKVLWNVEVPDSNKTELVLHYTSKDGEEGYPGTLDVTVHYELTSDNKLNITYDATTDKPTPVNLTNHSYFNLSGNLARTVLDEKLTIKAPNYSPVEDQIPVGLPVSVKGTPFDFNTATAIGARIDQVPGGYDHNWALDTTVGANAPVATLYDSASGRQLEVFTSQPGLQFYSGNFLDGSITARGHKVVKYDGLALETQHFPDSPNEPKFPNTILRPGEHYHEQTTYALSIK